MTETTPPDQPEDAALRQAIESLCYSAEQYEDDDGDGWPIQNSLQDGGLKIEIDAIMQLFHEHERQAVQAARVNELTRLDNDVTFCEVVCADLFHRYYLDRIAELTQPPAADTTKQGEGE